MSRSFGEHLRPHAVIAMLLCPLLACASRAPKQTDPTAVAADAPPPREQGGKTLEDLFAGRFPGVSVARTTDGGLAIRIRGGNNSFYASSEPLFVVDETPLPAGTGGIVYLDPYDIEKIEVLKNPADIALYGMRGMNGVIRITTKRPGTR